jgi:Flp pilus assembly protein TadD
MEMTLDQSFAEGVQALNASAELSFEARVKGMADAVRCFDRVLHADPRHSKAWLLKGVALATAGRFDEGLACLEEAQRLGEPQAAAVIESCNRALGVPRV